MAPAAERLSFPNLIRCTRPVWGTDQGDNRITGQFQIPLLQGKLRRAHSRPA